MRFSQRVHQFATASALSAGAFLLTAGATPDAAVTVDDAMSGRATDFAVQTDSGLAWPVVA